MKKIYSDIKHLPRLAAGPGWELPSHQDLVPSRSWHRAGTGPGAPIPHRFGPIPSHEKKFAPILIPWDAGMGPGWDWDPGPMPRNASIYNIYINIRNIQLMNISLESAH